MALQWIPKRFVWFLKKCIHLLFISEACLPLTWYDQLKAKSLYVGKKFFEMAVLSLYWTVPVPNKMRKAIQKMDKAYQSFESVPKILLKAIWQHASLHWIFENAPKTWIITKFQKRYVPLVRLSLCNTNEAGCHCVGTKWEASILWENRSGPKFKSKIQEW